MTDLTAFGLPADLPDLAPPDLKLSRAVQSEPESLTTRQKAAIVVRILLAEGRTLSLDELPHAMQAELARVLAGLQRIDPATERRVVAEFLRELELGGASAGGLRGALSLLEGSISQDVARELGQSAGITVATDPWHRLGEFAAEKIAGLLERESPETAAVCLSKLGGTKAAEVLAKMDGPLARHAAFAVARISNASPETARTIGRALLAQLSAEPKRAFAADPAEMVGSILLSATSATRDDILAGLRDEDATFAARVREEIFTFEDIATRIAARDIPPILRDIDRRALVTALRFARDQGGDSAASADFILENMSKRMAEMLRDEAEQIPAVKPPAGEAAFAKIVQRIRDLQAGGDLTLVERQSDPAPQE